MEKQKSTVRARCQAGWTLFHRMGDSFEYESKQEYPVWERHDEIVREYEEHNSSCDICKKGKDELQMTFEEMKVKNGPVIC